MRFTHLCVLVLLAASALAQDRASSIAGRALQAATGQPVLKAHVILRPGAHGTGEALMATTDEAGRFRFADLKPGAYTLVAEKPGYLNGRLNQAKPVGMGSMITIHEGDRLDDVTLQLFPAAAISGRVLDVDGEPKPRHSMMLWMRSNRTKGRPYISIDEHETDVQGQFRFDGLSPGDYLISANIDRGPPGSPVVNTTVDHEGKVTNLHDLQTFYPSASTLAGAQPIHVEAGQEESGIDIQVLRGRTYSVKGKIQTPPGPNSSYQIFASMAEDPYNMAIAGSVLANGDFSFTNLATGKYHLVVTDQGADGMRGMGESEITVDDQDVVNVIIATSAASSVRVRVLLEGVEKELTAGSVYLAPVSEEHLTSRMQHQFHSREGVYNFTDVPADTYQISFFNRLGTQSYLKSAQAAGRPVNPKAIEIAEGANVDVVLIYSKNVASLSGDVEGAGEKERATVHIVLVGDDGPVSLEPDQFLHFSAEGKSPGHYVVFAAQEDDDDLWSDRQFTDALQSQGTAVELHEKEQATVHPKLITKDVTTRLRQQLGF